MVGGGQLARMTHQAAIALGQTLRVLAAAPDDPAAQVTPDVVIGSHTDLDALRRVAAGADALTFDHEHVPTELLDKLVAEGVNVAPPPEALVHAQDKLVMRRRLEALGAPVPRYAASEPLDDVDEFAAAHRRPGGGQDGPRRLRRARGADGRATLRTPARSRPTIWPTGCRCWSRSGWRCAANCRRWWPARRSGRARRGRSWRPCSATASASR